MSFNTIKVNNTQVASVDDNCTLYSNNLVTSDNVFKNTSDALLSFSTFFNTFSEQNKYELIDVTDFTVEDGKYISYDGNIYNTEPGYLLATLQVTSGKVYKLYPVYTHPVGNGLLLLRKGNVTRAAIFSSDTSFHTINVFIPEGIDNLAFQTYSGTSVKEYVLDQTWITDLFSSINTINGNINTINGAITRIEGLIPTVDYNKIIPNSNNPVAGKVLSRDMSKLFWHLSNYVIDNVANLQIDEVSLPDGYFTVENNKMIDDDGVVRENIPAAKNICYFNCTHNEIYELYRVGGLSKAIAVEMLDANDNILAVLRSPDIPRSNFKIYIPYGVAKVIFVSSHTAPFIKKYSITNNQAYLYSVAESVSKLFESVGKITINTADLTVYGMIKENAFYPYTEKRCTPIYPYNKNCQYKYTGYGLYSLQPALYYDSNGNVLGAADVISGQVTSLVLTDVPQGTTGIRFCSWGGLSVEITSAFSAKIEQIESDIIDLKNNTSGKHNVLNLNIEAGAESSIISEFNSSEDLKQTFVLNYTLNNHNFNFKKAIRVNKTTGEETECKDMTDDICPVSVSSADYIAANHGSYSLLTVACQSHGKDFSDIGSIWSDGTNQFVLIGIKDSNNIYFMGENSLVYPNFTFYILATTGGTLTHVQNAQHTNSISYTSSSRSQWSPFYKTEPIKKVFIDNSEILESGSYYFNTLKITEIYEILNPASVLDKIKQSYGQFTQNPTPQDFSSTADVLLKIINTYTFTSADTCFVATNLCMIQEVSCFDHFGFTQCAGPSGNNSKVYIPKAKSRNNGADTSMDYRTIVDRNSCSGMIRLRDYENYEDNNVVPPDRILAFDDNIGIYLGYMFDYGVGGKNRRSALPNNTAIYISSSTKLYPWGWCETVQGQYESRSAVCFRKFIDRNKINTNGVISSIVFEYENHLYIYADFNAVGDFEVKIPEKFFGRQIETLEKRSNIKLLTQNASDKIILHVDTDAVMYAYFVGKI